MGAFMLASGRLFRDGLSWGDLAGAAIGLVFYSAMLFFVTFVFCLITTGIAIFSTRGVLWWLRWSPPRDRLAAFVGALAAYLTTLWFSVALVQRNADLFSKLLFFGVGPAGATLFGQYAGSMAAIWRLRRRRKQGSQTAEPWRFPLWQLLAAMVPLCMLLSLLSWLDGLTFDFLVITLAWLVWQELTWRPVMRLANRHLDAKLRSRRRRQERLRCSV
ncbi:hypothetical protein Mal64_19330 [Pseudobythopirellula maris]|uniref:Uncharacterized protein n=2 Tax=Pseudobythopirellula maris TaxID=2527991 RepID=A0A5C5ZLX5_9BACT|nr:hypothetical protein Mal64_19330 [Pseudobythopirellula maris]